MSGVNIKGRSGRTQLITLLKLIHISAAIVAVGANVTYAFWMRQAGTDRDRLRFAIDGIRRLDRTIANPAYVLVLLTGLGMVWAGAFPLTSGWILAALALYVFLVILGIAVYAPAIRRQANEAERDPTSTTYRSAAERSTFLGMAALAIVAVIVVLMVTKP